MGMLARMRLPWLSLIAGAIALLPVASAHGAGIELQHGIAVPMAPNATVVAPTTPGGGVAPEGTGPNLVCTADPRNRLYGNDPYDMTAPWDAQRNNPSSDDIVRDLQAGKSSDMCVGFALTPNVEENVIGADYDADHAWRVQPAASPFPDVPETHVWDVVDEVPVDGDDMRDIEIDLPAGYAGSPASVGTCTDAQFGEGNFKDVTCPAATQVGDASLRLSLGFGALVFHGPMAIGKVFNLAPSPNEVARLGAVASPDPIIDGGAPSKFIIRITLAPGTGRLRAIVKNAPRQLHGDDQMDAEGHITPPEAVNTYLPLYIEGVGIRIWGSKAAHPTLAADFGETGSNCTDPSQADLKVTTYGGHTSTNASPAFTPAGCDQLEFHPSVDVTTTERRAGVPTGVSVKLNLGQQSGTELRVAALRDAAVTLPAGLELGAQVGSRDGGLPLCSAAQFGRTAIGASTCPAGSEVGSVAITTPLIASKLIGKVFLGEQSAVGQLPALYVDASIPGATAPDAPRIKLAGKVTADDAGQITATFLNNPQLRFSEIAFDFPGGDTALFSTPRACGVHEGTSRLSSYARTAAQPVTDAITIDEECGAAPFAPTTTVDVASRQAGASSPTTIRVARTDRSPWLASLGVSLPSGLLADLKVPTECSPAQAQAAACPPSSRIGSVHVTAGSGARPLPLDGAIFLTERESGAVAGASIVVRAKIGGIDLGEVVVPGRIKLRPTDAGLDFQADVPTRFRGLALNLRTIDVALDREGFALSPTACGPLAYSATAKGDAGQVAASTGQATYTGCKELAFKPSLRATLTGDIRPSGFPGMYVELNAPPGGSNLAAATVALPEGVSAATKNVQKSCPSVDFDANACAEAFRVGTATAIVSITSEPVRGGVYLIRVPGESLPGLGLSFTGRFAQRVRSIVKVTKEGRLAVTFASIPDLPLRQLMIDVKGGAATGPLQLSSKDCANGSRWDGTFTGQGGQTTTAQTGLRCAAPTAIRLSDRAGFSLRLFDFGGRKLQTAKVTLPAGWSFDRARAARKGSFWARLDGGAATAKFGRKTLTLVATTKTATSLRVKVAGGAVRATRTARKRSKVPVTVRYAFTDGAVQTQTLSVATK